MAEVCEGTKERECQTSSHSSSNCLSGDTLTTNFKQEKFDELGYTQLMWAVEKGENEKSKSLLEGGANPFARNEYNNSAFFLALGEVNVYLIREFLKTRSHIFSMVPEIPKLVDEKTEDKDGKALLHFIAAAMSAESTSKLKNALELNEEILYRSCFALSTQAYEMLGGDSSDLFEKE